MKENNYFLLALFLAPLCIETSLLATEAVDSEPKRLTPFVSEPPHLLLNEEETEKLKNGKPIYQTFSVGQGTRRAAVFLVDAPKDIVADTIMNFSEYPKWIGEVKKTSYYKKDTDSASKINVDFEVGVMLLTWRYFIAHDFHLKDKGYATWTLDYDHDPKSEITDCVGFWRVDPFGKNQTKVSYSNQVQINLPGFIQTMMNKKGIETATTWVKEQSEKAAKLADATKPN